MSTKQQGFEKEKLVNGQGEVIRDGHDLRALDETHWGPGTAEKAARAVLAYNGETHDSNGKRYALRFFVNRIGGGEDATGAPDPSADVFEAWTPYRGISYLASTLGGAVATMLHDTAKMARGGAVHPDRPEDRGAPPIQHAISLLSERLQYEVERRAEAVRDIQTNDPDGVQLGTKTIKTVSAERHSQLIAALGTALAALGRVNDL